jgi:hypothetical protein
MGSLRLIEPPVVKPKYQVAPALPKAATAAAVPVPSAAAPAVPLPTKRAGKMADTIVHSSFEPAGTKPAVPPDAKHAQPAPNRP